MSASTEALKSAIEFEKKAVEKYREAIKSIEHKETRETLEKIVAEMDQQIDTAHWMIVAESGQLGAAAEEQTKETGATKLAAGKCPFSGEFAKMGIDMSKFDMSKFKS
ncbi:MAG: ferritin-like domain-containing protein [Nitrospinae bacterium]|nr:ferritin-like domain-containing protein [Nitrospinota bacterium]